MEHKPLEIALKYHKMETISVYSHYPFSGGGGGGERG